MDLRLLLVLAVMNAFESSAHLDEDRINPPLHRNSRLVYLVDPQHLTPDLGHLLGHLQQR